MVRLPVPGSDNNTWGDILNDYLLVSHDASGGLQSAAISSAVSDGSLTQAKVQNLTTDLAAKQPLDSDLTAIAALSAANDDILQRKSSAWTSRTPAQLKTDLVLTKADVGLANADNTSDANKPVSTAAATRFAALEKNILHVGAPLFTTVSGSPIYSANTTLRPYYAFADTGTATIASTDIEVPGHWLTYKVELVASADAVGPCAIQLRGYQPGINTSWVASTSTLYATTATNLGITLTVVAFQLATGQSAPAADQPVAFVFDRFGDDAGDTNAGFLRVYGLRLTKLT